LEILLGLNINIESSLFFTLTSNGSIINYGFYIEDR